MEQHQPVAVDPQTAQDAWTLWVNFTHLMKYSVIGAVTILSLMAIFLT